MPRMKITRKPYKGYPKAIEVKPGEVFRLLTGKTDYIRVDKNVDINGNFRCCAVSTETFKYYEIAPESECVVFYSELTIGARCIPQDCE